MLSCSCPDYDDCEEWFSYSPNFTRFEKKRRKRCCSCNELIGLNAFCIEFSRHRVPASEVEEKIYGDEIQMASWYMCESCGDIFLNLEDIGYCIILGDNMQDLLTEYWELTGFVPKEKN